MKKVDKGYLSTNKQNITRNKKNALLDLSYGIYLEPLQAYTFSQK